MSAVWRPADISQKPSITKLSQWQRFVINHCTVKLQFRYYIYKADYLVVDASVFSVDLAERNINAAVETYVSGEI